MRIIKGLLLAWCLLLGLWVQAPASAGTPFPRDQIEQLVAPIALYPDSLLAQVLMAATYPMEIVQAARWIAKNPNLKGTALENALTSQPWDPSVKALTNFPDVLTRMNDNLDWTQDVGDAMLAQQAEVMEAVQRMRRRAQEAGNLKTGSQQTVIVEEKIIRIEPATQEVYVPVYSPVVVYGSAWAPPRYYYPLYSYPPSYWYPPGYAASNIVSFGLGMAVGAAVWNNWNWGHCDWHGGNVNINNNFNFSRNRNTGNINIGNKVGGGRFSKWEHNPSHRGGVRYREGASQAKYSNARLDSARQTARIDSRTARGFDQAGGAARQRLDATGTQRAGSRQTTRPATGDFKRPESRDMGRQQSFSRAGSSGASRTSAFNMGSGGLDRAASQRGASSRSSGASFAGSRSYGGSFGGGGMGRGGGGGGRIGGGGGGGGGRGGGRR